MYKRQSCARDRTGRVRILCKIRRGRKAVEGGAGTGTVCTDPSALSGEYEVGRTDRERVCADRKRRTSGQPRIQGNGGKTTGRGDAGWDAIAVVEAAIEDKMWTRKENVQWKGLDNEMTIIQFWVRLLWMLAVMALNLKAVERYVTFRKAKWAKPLALSLIHILGRNPGCKILWLYLSADAGGRAARRQSSGSSRKFF